MPQGVEEPHKPAAAQARPRRPLPRKPGEGGHDRHDNYRDGPRDGGPRPDGPRPDGPRPGPGAAPQAGPRQPLPPGGLRLDDLYRLPMPKLFGVAEKEGIAEH